VKPRRAQTADAPYILRHLVSDVLRCVVKAMQLQYLRTGVPLATSFTLIMMVLRTRSNLEYGLLLKQVLSDRTDGTEEHQTDPKKMTTTNGPAYGATVKSSDYAQYGTAAKCSNGQSVV
jgi:hypothetical protein